MLRELKKCALINNKKWLIDIRNFIPALMSSLHNSESSIDLKTKFEVDSEF